MKNKLKYILISLLALITLVPSFALAIWYFNTEVTSLNETKNLNIDDIKENYSFDKKDDDEYTIYFYPSTLYYELAHRNEFEGSTVDLDSNYIEPVIKDNEEIEYDEEGKVKFNVVGDTTYYLTNVVIRKDYLNESSLDNKRVYEDYYNNSGFNTHEINVGTKDEVVLDNFLPKSSDLAERYGKRNLHLFNRFGFWDELNFNEGRYLPIKITVNSSFPINFYHDAIMNPLADMIDNNSWIMHFANWTYVDYSGDTPIFPYDNLNIDVSKIRITRALFPFNSFDNDQLFNFASTLEKYADENNVIRLYPTFSNGKGYYASKVNDPSLGGRDALKLRYELNDGYESNTINEKFFTYYHNSFTYLDTKINVGVINDFYLDKKMFKSVTLSISVLSIAPGVWFAQSYTYLDFKNEEGDSLFDEFLNRYGEGRYNLYMLIGNAEVTKSNTLNLTNILSYIDENPDETNNILSGRNLIDVGFDHDKGSFGGNILYKKPIMFALEKIVENKLIDNIETNNKSDDEIENYIQNEYRNNKSFFLINTNIYEANSNNDNYEITNGEPINKNNEYFYILKDINLIDSSSLIFELRKSISNDNPIILGTNYDYDVIINNPIEDNINNTFEFNDEDIFINAFNYFELTTVKSSNEVALKVKEDKKGVYDLILVFDFKTNTHFLYAYRHTNEFIKLFYNDVEVKTNDENIAYAVHKNDDNTEFSFENTNNKNELLFKKVYDIGEMIKEDDVSEDIKDTSINTSFKEAILKGIAKHENIDDYLLLNTSIKNKYIVRDHVSNEIIAYFNDDELIINDFIIRKNYIFYITTIN